MGVNTTGAIYKGFTFNGINSKDYGVYITGEGVYNAPERDVEIITIPARNGAFVRDNGRFENIVVSYPAGMFGDAQTDFAEGISDLRNALAATKGYCRLTDEYNPNEYREAVYKGGLEVSPEQMGRAGQFNILFECKPQRFLTSGETKIDVSSGDTVNNPTLFGAHPLLEVSGYGDIDFNGAPISIISSAIGRVFFTPVNQSAPAGASATFSVAGGYSILNNGDAITIINAKISVANAFGSMITDITNFTQSGNIIQSASGKDTGTLEFNFFNFNFAKGSTRTASASATISYVEGITPTTQTVSVSVSIDATGAITVSVSAPQGANGFAFAIPIRSGNSSKSALGDPIYIDLDIGEAYIIEGGQYVSVNNSVSLGAELPELEAGTNTITYDNTITALKITPRWWKV